MALLRYGPCQIDVPVKSVPVLLVQEVLNPFYIFQICALSLWIYDDYVLYSLCIIVISTLSIIASLRDTIYNLRNIRTMAAYSCPVNVLRGGHFS